MKKQEIDTEIWKDIDGFIDQYQVSNLGNVKSLERLVRNNHSFRMSKERILKPGKTKSGYYFVNLSVDGKSYCKDIHRMVALEFFGHENKHLTVNHKDGDKLNNNVSNLEFMTQAQNNEHKILVLGKRGGRCVKGSMNPMFGKKHSEETKAKISKSKLK
jgi:hypothetical protein